MNSYALGVMVIIFFLSILLLKQNDEKHSPEQYFTINRRSSWSEPHRGRVCVHKHHLRSRANSKDKNIAPSAVNGETPEPRSTFRRDKRLTHTRKRILCETTKPRRVRPGPAPHRGRGPRRAEAASRPPPAGPRTAAAARPAAGRPLTAPWGLPRPRAGAPASRQRRLLPPGPSSLLSHRRSPPREGDGRGRGGPRRRPSAPAQPRAAAEGRGAPPGPRAAAGKAARPLTAAA